MLLACSIMVVFGIVLNRFDVGLIAIQKSPGVAYFPSWMEIMISVALVSGMALVYIFCAENFKLFIDEPHEAPSEEERKYGAPVFDPTSVVWLGDNFWKNASVFSIISVLVIGAAAAFLPETAISGYRAKDVPVKEALGWDLLRIDGNRAGEFVLFDHKKHEYLLNGLFGEKKGCVKCHHTSLPKDGPSDCASCHSDMYQSRSIFDHDFHVEKLNGNSSCVQCHPANQSKSKQTAKACAECHLELFKNFNSSKPLNYMARGYYEAMHGLCITCHTEQKQMMNKPDLDQCKTCHTNPPSDSIIELDAERIDKTPVK